ncbi:MAG TPA: class I SAM-dependent methyltransferase [Verrucomicrobiae bacterium]|nr:class I SAM-dependent methyltransferase [Verrucomicrobiae bacterium]
MNSLIKTADRVDLTSAQAARMGLLSLLLSPCFLAAAWLAGGKGLGVHLFSIRKGLRLTAKKPSKLYAKWIYYPLDSTRYFEIDFVQRLAGKFQTWLDLSSPRLIAALLLSRNPQASSTLLNPDSTDIAETREMAELLGFKCTTINSTIDAVDPGARFDLVTCVSVLEHIPNDFDVLNKLWQMLNPGGRLILTVPACADGGTQLIDRDPYGTQEKVEGGYFFQRFYSGDGLRKLEQITGRPAVLEIWGEREKGWLQANFEHKRHDLLYPVWREPYSMARNWRRFESIDQLPGEGVMCAVYEKAKGT